MGILDWRRYKGLRDGGSSWFRRVLRREESTKGKEGVELHRGCLAVPLAVPLTTWSHTGWLQQPAECIGAAAEAVLAVRTGLLGVSGFSVLQGLVRSEALVSACVLAVAPFLMRWWAFMEAGYHDTLECRTVLQTYLIAAAGSVCALLASVAGKSIFAVLLQVVWRGAAARSLWTWSDLGRRKHLGAPGWLHGSVARWRIVATNVAIFGIAARTLVLLSAPFVGGLRAVSVVLSSPAVDALPSWLVIAASTPDAEFRLSASQLCLGLGLYAWISYYLCLFLPYRVLYDEYQDFARRSEQFCRDLSNGHENNVMLSTKLGPSFPKHLTKRMARMPPGNDRDLLKLIGIVRQKASSTHIQKAVMLRKNKQGKYGNKMTTIKPDDMRFWGSDLWERLKTQERRDEQTGWAPPMAAGSGMYKHSRATYRRIMREVKVELGKTDEEMETDPVLSIGNLMHFEPDAEDGDFDLVMQKPKGVVDAAGGNIQMKSDGHEMVVITDDRPEDKAKEAGYPLDAGQAALADGEWNVDGDLSHDDNFYYNKGDTTGQALEESIRSRTSAEHDEE